MKLRPVSKIILAVLYVLISFIILFPLLWMVATSLKAETEVFTSPPRFFGESLMFSNYVDAFKKMNFFLGMRNSLIITGGTMIGSILTSIFVAYGFARFKFPMKSTLFTILISMMALPFAALMVPQYLMFNNLKWINTFYPLIVPTLFGAPYYIFMARQYILSIPTALDEAARIDGCNYLSVLWRIIFPVCMPIVITIGLFQFRTAWNDFLGPNIYMARPVSLSSDHRIGQFFRGDEESLMGVKNGRGYDGGCSSDHRLSILSKAVYRRHHTGRNQGITGRREQYALFAGH